MIKLIMFDLGNVLLKSVYTITDPDDLELFKLSYEKMDNDFKRDLLRYSKENNLDYTYLNDRVKTLFKQKFRPNLTEQEFSSLAFKYKLGIASNFVSDIYDIFNDNIKQYFDLVCISGSMNVEKPSEEFFNMVIEEASYRGIFKDEILFIDDKPENLASAAKKGIHTMKYNNTETPGGLYEAINHYIADFDNKKDLLSAKTAMNNAVIDDNKERDENILKEKFEKQRRATFQEATVGQIAPITGEVNQDNNDIQDHVFLEELMLSLNNTEVRYEKDDKYPVFILLSYGATRIGKIIKAATKEPYTHGSISLDSKLKSLYSFVGKGFTHEDIKDKETYASKDDYKYSLYCIFVNKIELSLIDEYITNIKNNAEKFSYSLKGVIRLFFGKTTNETDKMFCSQFVSECIKSANASFLKKDPSLTTPYDLKKLRNCFFIKRGYLKNYDYKDVDRKVELIKDKIFTLHSVKNEGLSNFIKFDGQREQLILRYKKINYKEEYNKSHKYLKIYKEAANDEAIKDEIAKLWSYYLIIEEIYIQKAKENPSLKEKKEYKDAIIAKAFILGEVKDYNLYLINKDKNFDFPKYYENSKYNKDVVIITKNDIQTIIKAMKLVLAEF